LSEADTPPVADLPPLAKRRVFGAAFTAVAATFAIYMGDMSYRARQEFNAMVVAEPAHFAADLSKVGLYEGPFNHSSRLAHDVTIMLKLPGLAEIAVPDYSMFVGLEGTGTIVTAEGEEVAAFNLSDEYFLGWTNSGGDLRLTMLAFIPGSYTLRLNVTEPAAGLAGMEQIVAAKYEPCGLEVIPAYLAGIIAVATAIPALIVGGFTLLGWKRDGWRLRANTASDAIPGHEHA